MRAHHLIAIARRYSERLDNRVVYCVQQRPNLGRRATLDEVDVQQWHGFDARRADASCEWSFGAFAIA